MANSLDGYFETLVAAASEASATLIGSNALMDRVYTNYSAVGKRAGQTVQVPIMPSVTASITDVGVAGVSPTDLDIEEVSITLDTHYAASWKVSDFEQVNSPREILTDIVKGALGGLGEKIDSKIAALLTTGNFTTNTAISCTASKVTTTQFLAGSTALMDQKVNVYDVDNMSFVNVPVVYNGIVNDAGWSTAQLASNEIAAATRRTGQIPTSFGCTLFYDQAMNDLTTGSSTSHTYTGAYFHRYAIGLVASQLPAPTGSAVIFTYLFYKGVPLRLTVGWNQSLLANVATIDTAFGVAVVRENMGQLFTIAQS